jgi:hypothetical protein
MTRTSPTYATFSTFTQIGIAPDAILDAASFVQATAFGLRSVVGAQDLTPKQLMTLIEFCEKSSMVRVGVACADMLRPSSAVPFLVHASSLLLDGSHFLHTPYGTSEKCLRSIHTSVTVGASVSSCPFEPMHLKQQGRPLITVRSCTV